MSLHECPFCWSPMELVDGHGAIAVDTWVCEVCGARRSYGWEKLPDPDRLRRRADRLEQLAEEVEESELASRMEVA